MGVKYVIGFILALAGIVWLMDGTFSVALDLILLVSGIGILASGLWKLKQEEKTGIATQESIHKCAQIVGDTLRVSKRCPDFRQYLRLRPHAYNSYKGEQSKLVYRSATVGGITTGGLSQEGGGYRVQKNRTDRYEMFSIEYGGTQPKITVFKKISLTDDLRKKAEQDPSVSNYLSGKDFVIIEDVKISNAAIMAMAYGNRIGNTDTGMSMINSEKAKGYPTKEKCEAIIQFLSQSDDFQSAPQA